MISSIFKIRSRKCGKKVNRKASKQILIHLLNEIDVSTEKEEKKQIIETQRAKAKKKREKTSFIIMIMKLFHGPSV